jgi:hypothetical protein
VAVTDLFVFLRSLASHWGVLMTGGIPMAILALWEHWKGQSISWGVFSIGALVFVLWAAYLAWKDQHGKCVALSREVERLRPTRPRARGYVDGGLRDSINVSRATLSPDRTEVVIEWQTPFERTYHVSVQVVWAFFPGTHAEVVTQTPKMVTLRFRDQMGAPSPPQGFSFVAE